MKVGCIIMASGLSVRFGSNKLLAQFQGKSLIQRILDTTSGTLFHKRLVLTRTPEVARICKEQGVKVILHTLPGRNDAIKLGVENMKDMDGIVFCPCDQPLLTRESLEKMVEVACDNLILRMAFGERFGTPVYFGKQYFDELMDLPEKTGGSYVIKKYPKMVQLVFVKNERELDDVDTPEDLDILVGECTSKRIGFNSRQ